MGGVLILVCITASTLLWGDLTNEYVWIALLVMLGFGVIGWVDDWKKSCMHINKEIEIFDGEHLQKKAIFKDIDAQGNAVIESNEGEEVIATGQISIKGVY